MLVYFDITTWASIMVASQLILLGIPQLSVLITKKEVPVIQDRIFILPFSKEAPNQQEVEDMKKDYLNKIIKKS